VPLLPLVRDNINHAWLETAAHETCFVATATLVEAAAAEPGAQLSCDTDTPGEGCAAAWVIFPNSKK
jgi:hypothetical protein